MERQEETGVQEEEEDEDGGREGKGGKSRDGRETTWTIVDNVPPPWKLDIRTRGLSPWGTSSATPWEHIFYPEFGFAGRTVGTGAACVPLSSIPILPSVGHLKLFLVLVCGSTSCLPCPNSSNRSPPHDAAAASIDPRAWGPTTATQ